MIGNQQNCSRRRFLRNTALGAGAATVATLIPRDVLGAADKPAASETITYGVIGNGGRKDSGLRGDKSFRRVAVCDVDVGHLGGDPDGATRFTDFRKMLERKDIDVVCIATPPHWHALPCIAAAQAGKDIFCEKPFTKFIAEGRAVSDAVKQYGTIFQIGISYRFSSNRETHKICRYGIVKDLTGVVAHAGAKNRVGKPDLPEQPVPEGLDYDLWLGPAQYKPYNKARVHYNNRFYWDYEGGDLTNFGFHSFEPVQYLYAKDDTGPVRVEPFAAWPAHPDAVGKYSHVEVTYADGLKVIIGSGGAKSVKVEKKLTRSELTAEQKKLYDSLPDPPRLVRFADAIRTRQQAGGNAESSHRASTALNLANLAIRLGRTLEWDPIKERMVGDEEAQRLVDLPMRSPWHL